MLLGVKARVLSCENIKPGAMACDGVSVSIVP
jgi:hypothetical protein